MKKYIIGIPHCQNCARLSAMNPEIDKIEIDPNVLLPFARSVGIQSVPFIVTTGSIEELDGALK